MSGTKKTDEQSPENTDAPPLSSFENSVTELESLVETLETGDISLEEALARFERGVTLARQCQTMLKQAELRIDQLLSDADGNQTITPLNTPNQEGLDE